MIISLSYIAPSGHCVTPKDREDKVDANQIEKYMSSIFAEARPIVTSG